MIDCPECENSISDKAPSCPHCGISFGENSIGWGSDSEAEDSSSEKFSAGVMPKIQQMKGFLISVVTAPILGFAIAVPVVLLVYLVAWLLGGVDEDLKVLGVHAKDLMFGIWIFSIPVGFAVVSSKKKSVKEDSDNSP